jgi:TGS domain/ACT domain
LSAAALVRGDDEWRRRTKHWLINIREYIEEFSSSRDLVDAVRRDLLGNRVFVFTPGRNIVDLIRGSTPVDLAYAIHSDVGHQMIGAKVNGRMVCLDYKLQNADVVKIITSHCSAGPAAEWMTYAKSRTARQRIRQFLRAREREELVDAGRDRLADAARRHREPEPSDEDLKAVMPRLRVVLSAVSGLGHIRTVDALLIAVARGETGSGNLSLEETALTLLLGRRRLGNRGDCGVDESESAAAGDSPPSEDGEHGPVPSHDDLAAMHLALGEQGSMDGAMSPGFGNPSRADNATALLSLPEMDGDRVSPLETPADGQLVGHDGGEEASCSYVELATCCHPICGDEVMGVRMDCDANGVMVHRLHCDRMLSALRERPVNPSVVGVRWVGHGASSWEDAPAGRTTVPAARWPHEAEPAGGNAKCRPCQPGRIAITARDCDGLLSYVTGIVAGLGKSIRRSCTDTDPVTLIATLAFEVLVEDTQELQRILNRLKECEEVLSVRRVGANEGADFFPAPKRSRSSAGPGAGVSSGQATMIEIVKVGGDVIFALATGAKGSAEGEGGVADDEGDDDAEFARGAGHRLSSDMDMFEIDEMASP